MIKVNQLIANQTPGRSRIDVGKITATPLGSGGKTPAYFNSEGFDNIMAVVNGNGSVSATITVKGSNDGVHYFTIDTLTVTSSAAPNTLGKELAQTSWPFIQAEVTAISGTGAAVDLFVKPHHTGQ